jgi:hypothetical protein
MYSFGQKAVSRGMPCAVLILILFYPAAIDHRHYTSQHNTTPLAEKASILVPATLNLFTTTWHDAYGGGFCGVSTAFAELVRVGLGWVGRGGLDGSSYEGGDYGPECVSRSDFVWRWEAYAWSGLVLSGLVQFGLGQYGLLLRHTDSVERRLSTLNSFNVCTYVDILGWRYYSY